MDILKTKTMEQLTHEEIIKYANWVYGQCDSPISEIEWLVEIIINDDLYPNKKESLTDNIKELLENYINN